MDIHSLPGITSGQPMQVPKKNQSEPLVEGTFQQILGKVVAKSSKATDAAKQFEGLIMGQVLKSAREASDGGWLGSGGDQTGELALEMAEQGFAQALASRGGMGVAKMLASTLRREDAKAASSGSAVQSLPVQPSKDSGH